MREIAPAVLVLAWLVVYGWLYVNACRAFPGERGVVGLCLASHFVVGAMVIGWIGGLVTIVSVLISLVDGSFDLWLILWALIFIGLAVAGRTVERFVGRACIRRYLRRVSVVTE